METLLQDIRYGFRTLLKSRGFTLVAVLALALGIGANSAIFTVVNAVVLRPLPYPESERLVFLNEESPHLKGMSISYPNFQDWQSQNHVFESMGATQPTVFNLTGGETPEQVGGRAVSEGFFRALGIKAAQGRFFLPEEDQPSGNPTAVLSYKLWQRSFGGDRNILGRMVTLSDKSYTVIGILPRDFAYRGGQDDVFVSLGLRANSEDMKRRSNHPGIYAIARLKRGVSVAQAQAEMETIARRLQQAYSDTNAGNTILVQSYQKAVIGNISQALITLFAAVGFVLLIACANVANLLLARASVREKEIAIRTALGASRLRIVRQLLTESLLLALFGGILGTLLAVWGTDLLVKSAPDALPRIQEIRVDGMVLAFTFGAALLTGLLFGLFPALQASAPRLSESLKEGGRTSAAAGRQRMRSVLVVAEMALSLVLLVGAGLLIRSFLRLSSVNPGFNPQNVFTAQVFLPNQRYKEVEKSRAFFEQLTAKLQAIPGVTSAATITPLPLSGEGWQTDYRVDGPPRPAPGEYPNTDIHFVSPEYLKTMQVPVMLGRGFTDADRDKDHPVAIVNQEFVRKWFPGQDPLGKRIRMGAGPATENDAENPWVTVVGVAGDVRQYGLDADVKTEVYLPYLQRRNPLTYMNVVVRSGNNDALALTAAVRNAILSIDKDQPLTAPQTMDKVVSSSVASRRTSMFLLVTFASLALVLAAVGIYGVMSYSVSQRTREIGIRMALGAGQREVLQMIVGQALRLAGLGLAIGLALALGLTRLMSGLLFGVRPSDPLTFVSIPVLLGGVALLASAAPARRATRVDPMVALRYE
jgi:putative ABC transport system permease protein